MEHQEQRREETLIEPRHTVKYKNLLILKSTPPSANLSVCGNHRHVERSPFPPQFGTDLSTAFMEAVKYALGAGDLPVSIRTQGGPRHQRDLWEVDSGGRKGEHPVSEEAPQHHSRISRHLLLCILSTR